jgi:hypothetical protein
MSGRRRTVAVALLAALGIALAAAITYGTSQLVRQHIGLASEPLTAGSRLLAPPLGTGTTPARAPRRRTGTQTTGTAGPSVPAPAPAPTVAPEREPATPQPSAPSPQPSSPSGQPSSGDGGGGGDHSRAGDD